MTARRKATRFRVNKNAERRNRASSDAPFDDYAPIVEQRDLGPIRALNEAQKRYLCSIQQNTITFGIGPAGTGKSYIAAGYAADLLREKKIGKIIITRPCVEAGESLGFLPGELEEKYEPYIQPFREILNERLGTSFVDYLIKRKQIEAKPMAYMRGLTFKDAWVILDEAQNTSVGQMKLFLTRIGHNCKVIVDGDIQQKDIRGHSGLSDAIARLRRVRGVGVIEFTADDVVRSGIVKEIIRAYGD